MVANLLSKKAKRHAAKKAVVVEEEEEEVIATPIVEEESNEDSNSENEDDDDEEAIEDNSSDQEDDDNQVVEEERIVKNDEAALLRLTEKLKLKNLPWIETMEVTSSKAIEITEDENQDENMVRELAFYQQALEAARIARDKFRELDIPFSRPDDYYAEMLKSDEHMAKVRQRLLDEAARNKASEEARRQRNLKKFGKKVQIQKQLDRQKEKAQTLDKIKLLKRKRKDGSNNESLTLDNDFDVALEQGGVDNKRQKKGGKPGSEKSTKRQIKDTKYGFGGKRGKHHKSNTAESSGDMGGYRKKGGASGRGGKGGRR